MLNKRTTQKELTNLYELSQKAHKKQLPIMLTFGAKWCPFCHTITAEVLNPMILGGKYDGIFMLMRYVSIDDSTPILGFDNKLITKQELAEKYNADLVPATVFLDSKGNKVAESIIGITAIDFHAFLIHKALATAYKNMGLSLQIPHSPRDM